MAEYREFSAKTVSDCITDACMTFSVTSDRLDYEVVNEGSSGFIGLGVKPAVIKARIKEESFEELEKKQAEETAAKKAEEKEKAEKAAAEKAAAKEAQKKENAERAAAIREKNAAEGNDDFGGERRERSDRRGGRGRDGKRRDPKRFDQNDYEYASGPVEEHEEKPAKPLREIPEEEKKELIERAEAFLKDVFAAMKLEAKYDCSFGEDNTLNIDLSGEEMGLLIGKRGQTLDSLQYLVSLVVNKGTEEYVRIKVDTENYRSRRKDTLEKLAKNIAFKVKRTRRSLALEPMNPYERRIIHSALQNDRYVTTHSEGEEPYRKVVVTLKNTGRR